jgi:hydrogenase expression/formation protein HypD
MSDLRKALAEIAAVPLRREVRVLNLCGDQERIITLSEMRNLLPRGIDLVPGPGCAASLCPPEHIHQAIRLVERHDVCLLVDENLLRMPVQTADGVRSLHEVARDGADVRGVDSAAEAQHAAMQQPGRDCVYFVAGFETVMAPLAGMILDGLPDNLSILLCGRRSEPFVADLLGRAGDDFDALLLPGNRCALTGLDDWEDLVRAHRKPAAVAGYSTANILSALHALLQQHARGAVRVDNFYRGLARPEGDSVAIDRLDRVFELAEGRWRGFGSVPGTAYRLRRTYDPVNADSRFPDYRGEVAVDRSMPHSCQCGDVLGGRRLPPSCPHFAAGCTPLNPLGPCMASADATCFLHRSTRAVA